MPEIFQTNYESIPNMVQQKAPAFHVTVAGRTNGAHESVVAWLRNSGCTELTTPENSDYLLVFCPVASRVGTDIGEALEIAPRGKPVILVVMHHTFDPNHIIANSKRQVDKNIVGLTVDCLFHEGKFLSCNRNHIAWREIQDFLEISGSPNSICPSITGECKKHRGKIVPAGIVLLVIILLGWRVSDRPTTPDVESICQSSISSSWKKFHVTVVGKTDGAHEALVERLRDGGQTEASSPEDSDYLLVFCPIADGTDISVALQDIPGGKPVILVVMHHTSNPDQIVADSRRHVDKPNVCLTVDCLFYEGKLLGSDHNNLLWREIQKFLRLPVHAII